jgi:hypothetical protein
MAADSVERAEHRRAGMIGIALLLAVSIAFRLLALPVSTERNMDPDAALPQRRARARGHGFVNPAAWPAWMKPASLPMPETFKEPGYPWLISQVTPLARDPFRAGQWISLIAGCLIPVTLYRLARNLGADRATALLAGLLCAGSPRLIEQSVRVMVDSSFPFVVTLAFATASWRPSERGVRPVVRDALAGALLGLARCCGTGDDGDAARGVAARVGPAPRGGAGAGSAALAGIVVASPFLLRNLRLFGTPFYSDVGAFGLWPYVDHITFSHGLQRPPAPLGWALSHPVAVFVHWLWSAKRFFGHTLAEELLGSPLWCATLVLGLLLAPAKLARTSFAFVYLALTLTFIFAVNWDARYFVSNVPLWCLFAALGAVELGRRAWDLPLAGGVRGGHVLVAIAAITLGVTALAARRDTAIAGQPELDAARSEAPFLKQALGPDESIMAVRTSYWSWFSDRKSVHLVIASKPELLEVIHRLKVRYAALELSQVPTFAARYPGGRLPDVFVPLRADTALDLAMFRIREPAAGDSAAR